MKTAPRIMSTLIAASVAALTLVAVPAASAGQLESGTFDDSGSETFDDCGFEVREDFRIYGKYSISKGTKQTNGQFFRVKQQATYHGTYTNVQTGAYFTSDWHTNFRELPATIVDESGPVVTYQTKESGVWETIRDETGAVRYRDTGNVVEQYVFDTLGDSQTGGEFISGELVRTSGNFQSFQVDGCDIINELIG
ncbi:MAG: hypothetical protein ABI720_06650 [Actinomycetes bacterium]